jgi:hypothetical protein
MRELVSNTEEPWDIRVRALAFLDPDREVPAWDLFTTSFDATVVPRSEEGAAALAFLAEWARRVPPADSPLETILLPEGRPGRVLQALAGRPAHEYLRLLHDRNLNIPVTEISGLAETDDQDTRRFLCWYVGERRIHRLIPFLVSQIAADRPNTYPSQARRMFEAVFTAFLSEVIRAAAAEPEWLAEKASPKGLALSSLEKMVPKGEARWNTELTTQLLAAAQRSAGSKETADWTLSGRILLFLYDRGVSLDGRAEKALEMLARQILRRRGPTEAFILADVVHTRTGLSLPEFTKEEHQQAWDWTLKTLEPTFLSAVMRALPDPELEQRFRSHLLALGPKAANGSLHMVRTWGADIEGPGDWALCVAAFGIEEALENVESVLQTSWRVDAIRALVKYGADGAPALERLLYSDEVLMIPSQELLPAVESCLEHLEPHSAEGLLTHLRNHPRLSTLAENLFAKR